MSLTISGNPSVKAKEIQTEGNAICQQIEVIADIACAFSKAMKEAKQNGGRWACSGVTLVAGLNQLHHGNMISGLSMTTAGGLELINLIRGFKNYPQLTGLLENASAGTKMIKVLEEANKKSDRQIKAHLNSVEKALAELKKDRQEIEKIAKETDKKLLPRIGEVKALFDQTEKMLQNTHETFEKSKTEILIADRVFIKALEGLQDLIQLANSPVTEETAILFKEKSENLFYLCSTGRKALENALETIQEGQTSLDEARSKQIEAVKAMGGTIEAARQGLKEIALRAQNSELTEKCEKHLKAVQKEQKIVEARRQEQMQLLDRIEQMQQEEAQNGKGFGTASICCGMFATAGTAPVVTTGGLVAAGGLAIGGAPVAAAAVGACAIAVPVAIGGAVVVAVHKRHSISDKLHDLLYGKAAPKVEFDFFPIMPKETPAVRFAFDKKSSGIFGKWFNHPQSYTKGDLLIDLGDNQRVVYRVNLGEREALKWKDLLDLREKLLARLLAKKNPLSSEECKKILKVLEEVVLARGSKHTPRRGLIERNFPLFGDVRRALGL